MIIDAHAHASGDFLTQDSIVHSLSANKVDKVVLVPGELNSRRNYFLPSPARLFPAYDFVSWTNALTKLTISISGIAKHIPAGNEYVYALAQANPDRIIQFYWALLNRPALLQEMEQHYRVWRFKGIKLHQCWEKFSIRSSRFEEVAAFAVKNGLPIFIHVASKNEVLALIDFIKRHPEARFIIAHLFGLEMYLQADVGYDNVSFEISSYQLVSLPRLEKAVRHFGAGKIVLGSDTPYGRNNLRINIERVKALPISEAEKQMILGGNMQNLLSINGGSG